MHMKFGSGSARERSSVPSGLRRIEADPLLELLRMGVLVKLLDSARNSALTFFLILKFL